MRIFLSIVFATILLAACDDTRVFEKNVDFNDRAWLFADTPEFEFEILDTTTSYNVYCNVRNSLQYPFSRLFVTYYLQDSVGKVSRQKLVSRMIFDPKTGKPQGSSGLGDIYDHQFLLVQDHKFPYRGKHKIKFEQFMRTDTLEGVLAVGVRVERN